MADSSIAPGDFDGLTRFLLDADTADCVIQVLGDLCEPWNFREDAPINLIQSDLAPIWQRWTYCAGDDAGLRDAVEAAVVNLKARDHEVHKVLFAIINWLRLDTPERTRRSAHESDLDYLERQFADAYTCLILSSVAPKDFYALAAPLAFRDDLTPRQKAEALMAQEPRAAQWLDWLIMSGPHPDFEGRFYFSNASEMGLGYFDVIDRTTNKVVAHSKWARWSQGMAQIFCAFPEGAAAYQTAMDAHHQARIAGRTTTSDFDTFWGRLAEQTKDWRHAYLDFYDPFEPERFPIEFGRKAA